MTRFSPDLALVLLLGTASCAHPPRVEQAPAGKIGFDLHQLDAEGLRGPADGRTALDYEFCIPDTAEIREQVRSIDPSIRFMPGSRGRIGCGAGQCLCVGSTHQPDGRRILIELAALPYVERIQECFWE